MPARRKHSLKAMLWSNKCVYQSPHYWLHPPLLIRPEVLSLLTICDASEARLLEAYPLCISEECILIGGVSCFLGLVGGKAACFIGILTSLSSWNWLSSCSTTTVGSYFSAKSVGVVPYEKASMNGSSIDGLSTSKGEILRPLLTLCGVKLSSKFLII